MNALMHCMQEEPDPLTMDPLDLVEDDGEGDQGGGDMEQLEQEESMLFDVGTGMSRGEMKQVGEECSQKSGQGGA